MQLHDFESAFQQKIDAEIKIEPKDWMPDAYRKNTDTAVKQAGHQRNGGHVPRRHRVRPAPSFKTQSHFDSKSAG